MYTFFAATLYTNLIFYNIKLLPHFAQRGRKRTKYTHYQTVDFYAFVRDGKM